MAKVHRCQYLYGFVCIGWERPPASPLDTRPASLPAPCRERLRRGPSVPGASPIPRISMFEGLGVAFSRPKRICVRVRVLRPPHTAAAGSKYRYGPYSLISAERVTDSPPANVMYDNWIYADRHERWPLRRAGCLASKRYARREPYIRTYIRIGDRHTVAGLETCQKRYPGKRADCGWKVKKPSWEPLKRPISIPIAVAG